MSDTQKSDLPYFIAQNYTTEKLHPKNILYFEISKREMKNLGNFEIFVF